MSKRLMSAFLVFVVCLASALILSESEMFPSNAYVEYQPPVLPIKFTLDSDGLHVSGEATIVTPLGTFAVGIEFPAVQPNEILIVIRDRDANMDKLYRIASGRNIRIIADGHTEIEVSAEGIVLIEVSEGETLKVEIREGTLDYAGSQGNANYNPPPNTHVTNVEIIGYVTATRLNVRSGPGPEYEEVDTYNNGREVTLTGRNPAGNWVQMDNGSWLAVNYLDIQADLLLLPITVEEIGGWGAFGTPTGARAHALDTLRIRSGPGSSFRQLNAPETLRVGEEVDIIGRSRDNDWYQVNINGRSAWITADSRYVSLVGNTNTRIPITG